MFDAITYALSKAFTKKSIERVIASSMQKSDYDSDNDGVVDNAKRLNGNLSSYYAKVTDLVNKMDKSTYDSNDNGIVDNSEKTNNHTVDSDVPANAEFTDTKRIADMDDTDFDNLTDGETLVYNATTGMFENSGSSGGVGNDLTGQTVEPESGTTVIAGTNAEIFNDYRDREFDATTGGVTEGNIASGDYSHAEGQGTTAKGKGSHAEGVYTTATGVGAHAEGGGSVDSNNHIIASGFGSHAEGGCGNSDVTITASGVGAHAEGYASTAILASGSGAHAEGMNATATGMASHAEGYNTTASAHYSHSEGYTTTASGQNSHAEGSYSTASKSNDHAEGYQTEASGGGSHAEGQATHATGGYSHAEGVSAVASGDYSHAEGHDTTASGKDSHAEGYYTTASGLQSHAEGYHTTASGNYSHSTGYYTEAVGEGAFVGGYGNSANVVKDDGNGSNFLFGRWAIPKFNGVTTLPTHGTNSSFGFHAGTVSVSANTSAARTAKNGTGACIYDGAYTDKAKLEYQAIYILVTNAINATTGAQRGSSCYMVVGAGSESNTTPVLVQLGTTGTPPTVSVASGNVLNVKNESATYCTQYNLIRVA